METIGLIAGRGIYPFEWVQKARTAGIKCIVTAAFENETDPALKHQVDEIEWMRVGQLGRLIKTFKNHQITQVVMAGQIRPGNLFELKPDIKALMLLAKLPERNAETIFGAIANELFSHGITLLPATTFMETQLPATGWEIGPSPSAAIKKDIIYGLPIAREISRMDIGQTIVVKKRTVLAVEAFEGTNDAIRRGGNLATQAVAIKVSKPNQDFRFDVPVIGPRTIEVAAQVGLAAIAIEAKKTLLLEQEKLSELARNNKISVIAVE